MSEGEGGADGTGSSPFRRVLRMPLSYMDKREGAVGWVVGGGTGGSPFRRVRSAPLSYRDESSKCFMICPNTKKIPL